FARSLPLIQIDPCEAKISHSSLNTRDWFQTFRFLKPRPPLLFGESHFGPTNLSFTSRNIIPTPKAENH
ncbi:hypothetical protein LINPERHAP1_LOCUS24840, partial [Linum perenne]